MYIAPTIRSVKYRKYDLRAGLENSPKVRAEGKAIAITEVEGKVAAAKKNLLMRFDKHFVTKELKKPVGSKSKLLGGYGDLFSYVGFVEGSNPAHEIRTFLDESIRAESSKIRKVQGILAWNISVVFPEISDFDGANKVAEMEWIAGKSFVSQIEIGIPGIARYLSHAGYGRSGGGVQLDKDIDPKARKGRKSLKEPQADYLTPILKQFEQELN